jgi:phosphonate metabolism-associated iron-containing alcohol dehydrogenase
MKTNNFSYYNPVKIHFGTGKLNELDKIMGNRKALLLTSPSFERTGRVNQICEQVEGIVHVNSSVSPNPEFNILSNIYTDVHKHNFELIIALGGGSVIDTAKVISVISGTSSIRSFDLVNELIRDNHKSNYQLLPIIAIPTTAGTGSEVTKWATVWDMEEKKKYSLQLPNLWPEQCICDPELTSSLTSGLTTQTALDALSHSLESIWNKNANSISTLYAINASKLIVNYLPEVLNAPDKIVFREKLMMAALQAGLAFSNTETSIAHAISYYLTANKNTPHGIACSFSLPAIIDTIIGKYDFIDNAIIEIFGDLSSKGLRELFKQIKVITDFSMFNLNSIEKNSLINQLNNSPRAANSLVDNTSLFRILSK